MVDGPAVPLARLADVSSLATEDPAIVTVVSLPAHKRGLALSVIAVPAFT
jgi:hypothetical protein